MFFLRSLPVLLFSCLFLGACGYGFSGSGTFAGNVQRIFIYQVTDQVGEAGLATRMTDDLVYVITRSPQGMAVGDPLEAEAFLEGEVRAISQTALSRTAADTDIERRLHMRAFFVLKDVRGRVLWQRELGEDEVYAVGMDKAATENRRREALEILSLRMAEQLVNRLGDNF
ncbi:lipopolysaccharide assembly protein [Desulfobotulus alkaliphilus]|uniref:Lipopolysaccharide assembly protein n=2 Tax=Desulfobotulus alkaliphilus TaxID=622671 RepID=A0A562S7Y5_9BACT|nr:lipopolysaccharide assembly protein [Desulfobotulus alkaliphilus]